MHRYHFPVQNQIFHSNDEEGRDLADLRAAKVEARRAAGEILIGELAERDRVEFTVFVEDGEHHRILAIRVQATCDMLD